MANASSLWMASGRPLRVAAMDNTFYRSSLTCDYQPGATVNQLGFDLVVPDDDVKETVFEAFDSPQHVPEIEPGDRPLRRNQLRTMEVSLQTAEKALNAEITAAVHPLNGGRVVWEVYCGGSSRVSEMAESYGMMVERFGLETGWDFDDPSHRSALLRRLRDEAPDEVFLAPTCGPWSQMQNLAAITPEQQEALHEVRQWHHNVHLCFVKTIYLHQLDHGRNAHMEQPAFAWSKCACMAACAFTPMVVGFQLGSPLWSSLRRRLCLKLSVPAVMDSMSTAPLKAVHLVWVVVPATWRITNLIWRQSLLEHC